MAIEPAFPDALPASLQARLRRRAEEYRAYSIARSTKAVWTATDRDAAAERVARAAQALLDDVRSWYGRYSNAGDEEDARERAEARLAAWRGSVPVSDFDAPVVEMTPDEYAALPPRFSATELAEIRAGFDPESIGNVLLGLRLHMSAIAGLNPAKKGTPTKVRQRLLVRFAARQFLENGLEVKRAGRDSSPSLFSATCSTMLAIAGIKGRDGEALDPDHLIREVLRQKMGKK